MPKLATMAAVAAGAVLMCSACGGEADDRTVLFEECMKDKEYSAEVCQCRVDAQLEHYDKDVLRVMVLRALERHDEAERLRLSIPMERSTESALKYAFAATECNKSGGT